MFNLQNYLDGRNTEEVRMNSIDVTDGVTTPAACAVSYKQPAVY
jgi:hypothetical protein